MPDPRLARPLWRGRTNVDALTISCIQHAEQIVRERWPEVAHEFYCTQGSYQGGGGDPDSGSTHALGGGVDLRWCGHSQCLLAMRLAGMFVWHRKPLRRNGVLVWPDHFHGAPLDHPYMAPMLQRQQTAYLNRRNGLADNGPDDGPQLDPIPRPVWPWPPEDDMSQYAKQLDRIEAQNKNIIARLRNSAEREIRMAALLRQIRADVKDDATRAQVDKVLAELDGK